MTCVRFIVRGLSQGAIAILTGWAHFSVGAAPLAAQPTSKPGDLREDSGPSKGRAAVAMIHVDEPVHDFGVVWVGSPLRHLFKVENRGDAELAFTAVMPGREKAGLEQEPTRLAPGETSLIEMDLDSYWLHGPFSERFTIRSNDPDRPELTVEGKGECRWYVDPQPDAVRFGQVPPGRPTEQIVTLTNRSQRPMKLSLARPAASGPFEYALDEARPGKEYRLRVRVRPASPERRLHEYIDIKTNIPEQPLVSIPVDAVLAGWIAPRSCFPAAAGLACRAGEPPRGPPRDPVRADAGSPFAGEFRAGHAGAEVSSSLAGTAWLHNERRERRDHSSHRRSRLAGHRDPAAACFRGDVR